MTTSGTSDFNLEFDDIIVEAYERCGMDVRDGYDMKTAMRSVNLLFAEWANRGLNLWTIEQGTIPLNQGQITYNVPADTIDLLEHTVRTQSGIGQTDINITRISVSTYSTIPNKNARGRPIQVWINRQSGETNADGTVAYPTITVWPLPENGSSYIFVYTRLRRIYDAGTGVNSQDIPFRFLNPLVAGLAYYLSMKIPGADARTVMLKQMYDEAFQLAADEDREKAPVRFIPRQMYVAGR